MLRVTSVAAAVVALTMSAAAASDYSDTTNNFRINVPEGWTQATPKSEVVKYQILSPRVDQTRGNCTVIANIVPETRGIPQADLDAQAEKTFDDEFFKSGLKSARFVTDATIVSSGVKSVNGRKAFAVIADLTAEIPDEGAVKARVQQMIEIIPGQLFVITCTASDTGYAQEEGDFNIVLASFAPLSDAPVASLQTPGVSSLTLYAQPRFGGVSRVVTQDASNLAMFGWRVTTASVSIAGAGGWEVCDGANFTGRCQMITTTLATGLDGKAFAVASARHVKAILPPQAGPVDLRAVMAASVEAAIRR